MSNVLERADVPQEQRWNAESVFANLDAWQSEHEAVKEAIAGIPQYSGKLGESAETLTEYLTALNNIRNQVTKLYFYALMRNAVWSGDQEAKILMGQCMSTVGALSQKAAFTRPELVMLGREKLLGWVEEYEPLAEFKQYFEDLFRQAKYLRSSEVEEVLGMVQESFGAANQTATELTNTDLTFPDAESTDSDPFSVTQSSIRIAMGHPDRELRRDAWQGYADRYREFENTLTAAYTASVRQSTMMMRARGYDSVLHMQLEPHNLPIEVFHNLIDTYQKNLPTWHRYWDVKRRMLGYDEIHPWDIWAPMTQDEPQVTFEEAVEMIAVGMQPLGDDYVKTLRRGCLEERWVDYAVNKGKRQGAFSGGTYDTYPFIMMSFDGQLSGMSTLAHELGHSMHSYYSRTNQPPHYAGYSMFVAEVASNFNQALVRAHLFANHDDRDFQLALIQEAMDNFHRYFFIMPTLASFEYAVHERIANGQPVTANILNGIMADLFAKGYGETMSDDPERTGITWAQFGHLYVPFYTFQYATGISAAHALADHILEDGNGAAENYVRFLSSGSAVYPLDALKIAGVDMTTPTAVEKTYEQLSALVDRLENLI